MALYVLTQERFINGIYVYATSAEPKVVDMPAGTPNDPFLTLQPTAGDPPVNDVNAAGVLPADNYLP